MNDRGIVCVRFIDDFVILGSNKEHVKKAYSSAKKMLRELNLECHDPYNKKTAKEKAQHGHADNEFIFLGHVIKSNYLAPSEQARKKLLEKIGYQLSKGRQSILKVLHEENSFKKKQRYVQTLDVIDRVIRGWGDAFAYANDKEVFNSLDKEIDEKLKSFKVWYANLIKNSGWKNRRRTSGVCLLGDIKKKKLDALPFRFPKSKTYRSKNGLITISTDGSMISDLAEENGFGGWAAVFHETNIEISGYAFNTTNNKMELTAVVEALKNTPIDSRIHIRTDSEYVYRAIKHSTLINSNFDLWRQCLKLNEERRISIEKVEGHSGDHFNDKADKLAREQAKKIRWQSQN